MLPTLTRCNRMTADETPTERNVVSVNIRIPADLHARLVEDARRNRRSLNQQMLVYLEQGSDREAASREIAS